MADYYPLIARAVGGLDSNTGENRRALYERARAALVNQLRGVDPPLDEDEITRERLALEEAIRRVETEAVTHAEPKQPETVAPPASSSLRDQALRNFRETVAEAEGLGEGAAEANRVGARDLRHTSPAAAPLPPPTEATAAERTASRIISSRRPKSRRRPISPSRLRPQECRGVLAATAGAAGGGGRRRRVLQAAAARLAPHRHASR